MNFRRKDFLKLACGISLSILPQGLLKADTETSIQSKNEMQTDVNDEQIFHEIMKHYVDAWNKRDIARWSQIFTDDVDYINRGGGWWTSNEENIEGHRKIFEKITELPQTYDAHIEKIAMLKNDVALLHVRWSWPGAKGTVNPDDIFKGIMSLVLIKNRDRWLIRSVQNTVSA